VDNPWPPTPTPAPPPPHIVGDLCGSGGDRGVAHEHISYTTWRATYMTGVPIGHWSGRFVAVCDPEPPPDRLPGTQESPRTEFDGDRLIDADTAAEVSRRGLETAGLLERDDWRSALADTTVGQPVLVQRLDRVDDFYWIVPYTRERVATAVVNVDARFGEFQQARALPEPRDTAFLLLSREEVEESVYGRLHQLPGRRGELVVRPGLACITDHWVWRPCRESLSPFSPFTLISYGGHRLYVRSDGRVFTRLTTTDGGL
jgi:hypothetical protein